jgi:uncharacterized repeat protein (TIGR01451 family)
VLRALNRRLAVALAGVLAVSGLVALEAPTADAYNVCSDPGAPCTHERMSAYGIALLAPGSEAAIFAQDIWDGAGHEDVFDHIYGIPFHEILEAAIITMTHFWDADPGDDTPSTYGDFEEPVVIVDTSFIETENALQKSRHFWTLALGAYADGRKAKAYEYLGHIVHFLGDMTVPTHAHGDAHVDLFNDHDPFEEWMSDVNVGKMLLTDPELESLRALERGEQPAGARFGPAGPLENSIPAGVDPLYWLIYTTNQRADFFASRDVDGDTSDRHGWVQGALNDMAANISSPRVQDHLDDNDDDDGPFGEEINDNDGDLSRVREITYMYGIRAIAALYRHFDRTVHQPTLAVGIDYVEDSDDDADTLDDADFFGKVTVNGQLGQNRGEEAVDTEVVVDPGWAYGASAPLTGSVPVHIEIIDEDGESPLVPSLNGPDDLIDIDPDDDEDDSTLDLQVDMDKCIKRLPDAVSGDVAGACGQTFETEGDHDPLVGDSERAKVRFRVLASNAPPSITKAFGAPSIIQGQKTSLTFTLTNPNATPLTGAAFDDPLPSGLVVATPNGLTNNCGGAVTAVSGSGSIALSGGTIPAANSCTVKVDVLGTGAGIKDNSTSTVTTAEGLTGTAATASLTVIGPPELTKAFAPSTVPVGGTTRLTFTLKNPNPTTALTRMTFSDPFPSGLRVATNPGVTHNCGGAPSVGPFALAVAYGAATLPPGGSCTFSVNVTATSAGVKDNTTTIVSSTPAGPGKPARASVTVT